MICTELYHHGIKGQKWGVRRFQNTDGSLTAAGKKRYSKSEREEIENNINNLTSQAIDKCQTLLNKANDDFNEYLKSMDEDIAKIKNDKKARSDALNMMKDFLGSPNMVDDDELIELAAYEVADSLIKTSKKTDSLAEKYKASFQEYGDSVKDYSDKIMAYSQSFSDKKIQKLGEKTCDKIIENTDADFLYFLYGVDGSSNHLYNSYSNSYNEFIDTIIAQFNSIDNN